MEKLWKAQDSRQNIKDILNSIQCQIPSDTKQVDISIYYLL